MEKESIVRITSDVFRRGEVDFKLLDALHSKKFIRELVEVTEESAVIRCMPVSGSSAVCDLILDRLEGKKDCKDHLDISFTYIAGNEQPLLRKMIKDNPKIIAKFSFFDGNFNFSRMRFDNPEMLCSTFRGSVDFNGSVFMEHANFSWSMFEGNVNFNGVVFEGDADFSWSAFKGYADFNRTVFGGNADFNRTTFEGDADVNMPVFENEDVFTGTTFESSGVNVSMFDGNANFNETVFKGDASFVVSRFIRGDANFNGTIFENNAYFNGSTFEGLFRFLIKSAKHVCFNNAMFENAAYISGPIESLDITDAVFGSHLKLDWNKNKVELAIKEKLKGKSKDGDKSLYETVSKEFIILKEKYHSQGDYISEDKAYLAFRRTEMETKNHLQKALSYFADWVGQYGTSPLRVAAWMIIIVFIFGIFYSFVLEGIVYSHGFMLDTETIAESFYTSGLIFTTLGFSTLYAGESLPRFMFAVGIEGFLGVFMIAYFTICFSRKMLR